MNNLREDELSSRPLVVGQRPELPGLEGNLFWLQELARVQPYKPTVVRTTSGEGYSQQWLAISAMIAQDIESGMANASMVKFCERHQHNIDKLRPEDLGSACCAVFVHKLIKDLMSGCKLDRMLESQYVEQCLLHAVRQHDNAVRTRADEANTNGGSDVTSLLQQLHMILDSSDFMEVGIDEVHKAQLISYFDHMRSVERAACATTALPCSSGKDVGEASGDTFAILWETTFNKFAIFESHPHYRSCHGPGEGILLATCDGPEELVNFLFGALLPMMRCQLRWIHCVRVLPPPPKHDRDEKLREQFHTAGRVCKPWQCDLADMYDVRILEHFVTQAAQMCREHGAERVFDEWFGDALFFVAHQLRFSALVDTFLQQLSGDELLWTCARQVCDGQATDDALEVSLRNFLESLNGPLEVIWQKIRPSDNSATWDATFYEECIQIPGMVRRQLGMYAYGFTSWALDKISLKNLGAALALTQGIELLPEKEQQDIAQRTYKALCRHLPDHLQTYTAVHKIRGRLMCKVDNTKLKGWFFGESMSSKNLAYWKALGKPSTQEFKELLGAECGDLDCGFLLCCVGQLIDQDVASLQRYDHASVMQRMEDHIRGKGVRIGRAYWYHMPHQILKFAKDHGMESQQLEAGASEDCLWERSPAGGAGAASAIGGEGSLRGERQQQVGEVLPGRAQQLAAGVSDGCQEEDQQRSLGTGPEEDCQEGRQQQAGEAQPQLVQSLGPGAKEGCQELGQQQAGEMQQQQAQSLEVGSEACQDVGEASAEEDASEATDGAAEDSCKRASKRIRLGSLRHWRATDGQDDSSRTRHLLAWPDGTPPPLLPKKYKEMRVTCTVCARSVLGKSWRTLERDAGGCLGRPETQLHARMRAKANLGISHAKDFIANCPCCRSVQADLGAGAPQ